MRADIRSWCRACLTCATQHVGQAAKPPLTPIPVAGPFDRVGVDVIKFPMNSAGNQYAVVFMDYLTKWPEVFATSDQSALTIACLLVEQVISRHGVPAELLSDRGKAFLSKLLHEVYDLMSMKTVNTTAYHPQMDGLIERFNRTLTSMLAKTVNQNSSDWDKHLLCFVCACTGPVRRRLQRNPLSFYCTKRTPGYQPTKLYLHSHLVI